MGQERITVKNEKKIKEDRDEAGEGHNKKLKMK